MPYCFDVEHFIREIRKRPQIWDFRSEDSRFKNKKQDAWDEVCRIFIERYDDLPSLEKIIVHKKLHGKWRNIRDSFVRYLRRPGGKKYMYSSYLTFLNELYSKNDSPDSPSEADKSEDESDSNSIGDDDEGRSRSGRVTLKRERIDASSDDLWAPDVSDSHSTIENLKRRRVDVGPPERDPSVEFVDAPFAADTSCFHPSQDDDRSFFESLLPAVREFDIDQKLDFRSQVINLIKNIRCTK